MATLRFSALEESLKRKPVEITAPSEKISDYYRMHVFYKTKMAKYLSKDAFKAVNYAIDKG